MQVGVKAPKRAVRCWDRNEKRADIFVDRQLLYTVEWYYGYERCLFQLRTYTNVLQPASCWKNLVSTTGAV